MISNKLSLLLTLACICATNAVDFQVIEPSIFSNWTTGSIAKVQWMRYDIVGTPNLTHFNIDLLQYDNNTQIATILSTLATNVSISDGFYNISVPSNLTLKNTTNDSKEFFIRIGADGFYKFSNRFAITPAQKRCRVEVTLVTVTHTVTATPSAISSSTSSSIQSSSTSTSTAAPSTVVTSSSQPSTSTSVASSSVSSTTTSSSAQPTATGETVILSSLNSAPVENAAKTITVTFGSLGLVALMGCIVGSLLLL